MSGLFRLVIFAALIWALYRLVRSLLPSDKAKETAVPGGGSLVGGELVQDPQCGVYIPKDTAVRGVDGTCFCSPACREAFEAKDG